jgi:hypothetical protein
VVDDGLTVTIRLAPDGRVLFHDLNPDLVAIARLLNPLDTTLQRRGHAAEQLSEDKP